MSLIIPYSELNSTLTPEQNAANMIIVAEIIKQNQLRSVGVIPTDNFKTNERSIMKEALTKAMFVIIITAMLLLMSCGTTEPTTTEVCNPYNAVVRCKAVSPLGAECTYTTFQKDCKCRNNRHSWNIP